MDDIKMEGNSKFVLRIFFTHLTLGFVVKDHQ